MSTPTSKKPIHLILDWDGTLTVRDTMSLLGKLPQARDVRLAAEANPRSLTDINVGANAPNRITSNPKPHASWDDFAKAYLDDYSTHKAANFPGSSSREDYITWLAGLKPIEERSVRRVQSSGFFYGVKSADIAVLAREAVRSGEVQLRHGWASLFHMFLSPSEATFGMVPSQRLPPGSKITILSVNWSESFIRFCLRSAILYLADTRDPQLLKILNSIEIVANEIVEIYSAKGSNGKLYGEVRTAGDKLSAMRSLTTVHEIVVYVGDSATDFECLVNANVGVLLCEAGDSESQAQRTQDIFKPLDLDLIPASDCERPDAGLYWANDFQTIIEVLRRLTSDE